MHFLQCNIRGSSLPWLPAGDIDRSALGQLAFADAAMRRKLNKATHAPIMLEIIKQLLGHWLSFKQVVVSFKTVAPDSRHLHH